MFLTSDVCSRYGLEAMGQARYGPVGKAAAAWEKKLPSHQKLPRICVLLSLKAPTGHQGHKNPLKMCHCQSTFMLGDQDSSSRSCFFYTDGRQLLQRLPRTPTPWHSCPCETHSHWVGGGWTLDMLLVSDAEVKEWKASSEIRLQRLCLPSCSQAYLSTLTKPADKGADLQRSPGSQEWGWPPPKTEKNWSPQSNKRKELSPANNPDFICKWILPQLNPGCQQPARYHGPQDPEKLHPDSWPRDPVRFYLLLLEGPKCGIIYSPAMCDTPPPHHYGCPRSFSTPHSLHPNSQVLVVKEHGLGGHITWGPVPAPPFCELAETA